MNKKLGYYSVGKIEFESKVKALIFATEIYNKMKKKIDPRSFIKDY